MCNNSRRRWKRNWPGWGFKNGQLLQATENGSAPDPIRILKKRPNLSAWALKSGDFTAYWQAAFPVALHEPVKLEPPPPRGP